MFRVLLLAFSLLFVVFPSKAQHVYVWRDAHGIVNYSDSPPVGGGVGQVRKLRVHTFTATGGSSAAPSSSLPSSNTVDQVKSIASGRALDRLPSEIEGGSSSGRNSGGGLAGGGSSGGGTSIAGGSGSEGAGGRLAAGNRSTSGSTTTASSSPGLAVPISTAPAPDVAVPISTAPAPDLSVPISTAPAPDLAVPISTTPATATSSATTTPSGGPPNLGVTSGSNSTWSQIAGGPGGNAQATLYWDQPKKGPNIAKSPVAGYRVYFGTNSGAYFQPFGQGVDAGKVTSYTVQGLASGTTYYFAVTTYVGGHESPYSNQVSKDIP